MTKDLLPPHSEDAEQGVIGCCLMSAECVGLTVEKLKGRSPEAFYILANREIWDAICDLHEQAKGIDLITVVNQMKFRGSVPDLGYMSGLVDKVPTAVNIEEYAEILRDHYMLRQLQQVCAKGLVAIRETLDPKDSFEQVEKGIMDISTRRVSSSEMHITHIIPQIAERVETYQRGKGQVRGLSTGFVYLDKMISGINPGELIVLGGRPGAGKTSFALNMAENIGLHQKTPGGIFSLEMTKEELAMRMVFQNARKDFHRFRTGFMANEDLPALAKGLMEIQKSNLIIEDRAGLSIMEVRAIARRWKAKFNIGWLAIDYLQLMRGSNRRQDRQEEVAEISVNLKAMAKELSIPVVALAQLNRETEKEKSRKPQLSDLRESGQIEQDADMVGILYKPTLKPQEEEELAKQFPNDDWSNVVLRVNLAVCKQRNGPTGDVHFLFRKACMRFEDYKRSQMAV